MGILGFISDNINLIINIFGGIILCLLIINGIRLSSMKNQIEEATNRTVVNTYINVNTMEAKDKEEKSGVTPDTIRLYEKKFNVICSGYYSISQMIPIFPLCGILGTVAGLIGIIKESGIDQMAQNMDTALYSTLWGLVWTIGLKIFVAVLSSRMIEDTEIILDDYDKKINNSYMQGNIVGEVEQ